MAIRWLSEGVYLERGLWVGLDSEGHVLMHGSGRARLTRSTARELAAMLVGAAEYAETRSGPTSTEEKETHTELRSSDFGYVMQQLLLRLKDVAVTDPAYAPGIGQAIESLAKAWKTYEEVRS